MNSTSSYQWNRRHFLKHLAGASALALPAFSLTQAIAGATESLKRAHKSAILLWMEGGPPTIDIWDLKPGAPTGGPFKPISTAGDFQICEKLPLLAKHGQSFSVVRSMSTREADHERGRYYMHTGFAPTPSVEHPSYGAVVAHQLADKTKELEIPPFVAVGGSSIGPGFLGMSYAPFVVSPSGEIRDLKMGVNEPRMHTRLKLLSELETGFIKQKRGSAATDHEKVLKKTTSLLTSQQMEAFKADKESQQARDKYGNSQFGRSCLLARRLVEAGVPFVEVNFGGWDLHNGCFTTLERKLPELDQGMAALFSDLAERGLLDSTVILWMGEFGRTPRINGGAGRDHWARSWSVAIGGGQIRGGVAIGETSADGAEVESEPYTSQDLMATVCKALGIPLDTTFTTPSGRPMKIANSGKVIEGLFA